MVISILYNANFNFIEEKSYSFNNINSTKNYQAIMIIYYFQRNRMSEVKKYLKKDWTVIPFMVLTLLGFVAAILDFVYLQNFSFQIFVIPGLILLLAGSLIRMKARLQLKKKQGSKVSSELQNSR